MDVVFSERWQTGTLVVTQKQTLGGPQELMVGFKMYLALEDHCFEKLATLKYWTCQPCSQVQYCDC